MAGMEKERGRNRERDTVKERIAGMETERDRNRERDHVSERERLNFTLLKHSSNFQFVVHKNYNTRRNVWRPQ